MSELITQEQFAELRREVQETKWLSFTVLQVLVGKEKTDKAFASLQAWIDCRRFDDATRSKGLGWRTRD